MADEASTDAALKRLDRLERDQLAFHRLVYRLLLEVLRYYERTYGFSPPHNPVN